MEKVYEKLLKDISKMTPEQKKEEWECLKRFNDVGPTVEEYLIMAKEILKDEILITIGVSEQESLYSNYCFYLAA